MKNIINLIVKETEKGQRVDQFISNSNKVLSRNRIKNLILNRKLKINQKISINPSSKVNLNDKVELEIPIPVKTSIKPYNFKLNILFEDNDLLVINKPAGISMHPGAGDYDKTLVNALVHYDKKNLSSIGDELRPGIIHRIDKDTSGLVVIAKNNFTGKVIEELNKRNIKLNITAVYSAKQTEKILKKINKKTKVIISIFAGRTGDAGKDPVPEFLKSIKIAKKFKNVEILWASVREPYNYLQAKQLGCHIITIPPSIIEKIEKFGKSFNQLTAETVKAFLLDSKKSKFKI